MVVIMKALLITKCGCSKTFDLISFTENIEVFIDKGNKEKRKFKYFDKQIIDNIELIIYKEI